MRTYTAGEELRLLVNGREAGRKPADALKAEFQVPYEPGELTVVAYRGGREIARKTLQTTGAPARLRLRAEQDRIGGGAGQVAYVFVEVLDSAGRFVADAAAPASFAVDGAARLLRAGSANPFGVESFQDAKTRT